MREWHSDPARDRGIKIEAAVWLGLGIVGTIASILGFMLAG
jgi:hypothetical protein